MVRWSGSITTTAVPRARTSATSWSSLLLNHERVGSLTQLRLPSAAVMADDTITRSNPSIAARSRLVDECTPPVDVLTVTDPARGVVAGNRRRRTHGLADRAPHVVAAEDDAPPVEHAHGDDPCRLFGPALWEELVHPLLERFAGAIPAREVGHRQTRRIEVPRRPRRAKRHLRRGRSPVAAIAGSL